MCEEQDGVGWGPIMGDSECQNGEHLAHHYFLSGGPSLE